eukprot:14598568-Alexandrium_andersonii.AAC.1
MPKICLSAQLPAPGPRAKPSAKIENNAEGFVPWYTTDRSLRWAAACSPPNSALPGTHSGSGLAFSMVTK